MNIHMLSLDHQVISGGIVACGIIITELQGDTAIDV